MKVDILASGSTGNCIALTSGESTILIDAGVAKTKIEKRLLDVGVFPQKIEAIFITHSHKDHTKGLPLANKYKIPVFAGEEEWKDINLVEDDFKNIVVDNYSNADFYPFVIRPFSTNHDAFEPLGYAVFSNGFKVSICLDTGHVDSNMINAMKDSNVYIIEANHEPRMVAASNYPLSVQARILSDVGHLSNEQTAEALSQLVQGKGEQIYLTHLSSKNNMPSLAEMTVIRKLFKKGLRAEKDYKLEVIT